MRILKEFVKSKPNFDATGFLFVLYRLASGSEKVAEDRRIYSENQHTTRQRMRNLSLSHLSRVFAFSLFSLVSFLFDF